MTAYKKKLTDKVEQMRAIKLYFKYFGFCLSYNLNSAFKIKNNMVAKLYFYKIK